MKPERPEADVPMTGRKTADRAMILLLLGCLLLLPPLASIFQLDWRILGIPFTAIYLFVVWGGLIAGTAVLARRLQREADHDERTGDRKADASEPAD